MKIKSAIIAIIIAFVINSPIFVAKAEMTPLEVQALQTKEFEAEKMLVLSSVISVFQDLGYIILSADKDMGFITAESPAATTQNFGEMLISAEATKMIKATAFVEEIRPNFTRVRLNFVKSKTTSSAYGQASKKDKPILDPKVYQNAFDKIDEALFVRKASQ